MGKSEKHTSSVGLIMNLQMGYIPPLCHVIYDTSFQTVMDGYGSNDAASDHIWDSFMNNITLEDGTKKNFVWII